MTNGTVTPTDTVAAQLAKLREPFPPEAIGKLPRGGVQLDFVGHATVTDRLLTVDPYWNWEPLAFDEAGLPLCELNAGGKPCGLWIKLTVLGVTRLGYGSVEGSKAEPVKELIGDALRNAAMRFGVALDLWSKSDLESQVAEPKLQANADRSNVSRDTGEVKPRRTVGPPGQPQSKDEPDPLFNEDPSSDFAPAIAIKYLMKWYATLDADARTAYDAAITEAGVVWPKSPKGVAVDDYAKLLAAMPGGTTE